jgi:signal transduction histidine kinase
MAKLTFDQKEKSLAMLSQAEKALHQSVNLTSQLLTFSKGGKPVKKVFALRPLIENSVAFALSGSRVTYEIDLADNLRAVEADEGQIGQVIQNIVLNADQAMPLGGMIRYRSERARWRSTRPPACRGTWWR